MSADVNALFQGLQERHPNLFHAHPRSHWKKRIDSIKSRLDSLDPTEFLGELRGLVALAQDGHTGLRFYPGIQFHPIRIEAFHDGFFIIAADPEVAEFLAGRITAVGEFPVEDAFKKSSEFLSVDNEESQKHRFSRLLRTVGSQHQLGLTSNEKQETLKITKKDGSPGTLNLTDLAPSSLPFLGALGVLPENWLDACDLEGEEKPLWLRDNDKNYWFEYLEDSQTVYMQYNVVGDARRQPLSRFCSRMFKFIENEEAKRLIIDLRHNGGGNGYLNQSLIHGLIRNDRVNRPGGVFVITRGKTFSAAMMACNSLEKHTQALFVGEPTGAPPNHYGDAQRFSLPNNGATIFCSTVAWGWIPDPQDTRKWIAPDIAAPITFKDYRTGRDPALEAILSESTQKKRFPYMAPNTRWYRESQNGARR